MITDQPIKPWPVNKDFCWFLSSLDKPQLGYSLESADGQDPEKNENIKNVNKSTNLFKLTV